MKRLAWTVGACCILAAACSGTVYGQWSTAQLLNDPAEAGSDVKNAKIVAARAGGFHCIYHVNNQIRYKRYTITGGLGPGVTVFPGANFIANGNVAESLSGEIHIVFEDWAGKNPNVRWYKSSDGGASFPVTQVLTNVTCAKHPQISGYGLGDSPEAIMSYFRSGTTGQCDKSLRYRRYNGSTWSAEAELGSYSHSEYDCFGMARSPLDGSVYRTFDPSDNSMKMRQYTGAWGPEIPLVSGSWAVRQHMAINANGQVMLVWDSSDHIKSLLYTPGVGPGPQIDLGPGGYSGACDVCAIPGTADFYMVVGRDIGWGRFHVYGRKWTGGNWQPEESIMSLDDDFLVTPVVTADAAGRLYCIWEYWGTNKPQQWFSVRNEPLPPGPKGTISGVVRDYLGAPLPNASVNIANIASAVSLDNGTYSVQVPVGTYSVECSKTFYSRETAGNLAVIENGNTVQDFKLATQPPAQIATLNVVPGNQANTLTWTGPASSNFNGTMLRFSATHYPLSPLDGEFLADVPGTPGTISTFTHSGLINGTMIYYSAFAYFQDASRFYASGRATAAGTPFGPGDYDHDGDVDQSDFAHFQTCLTGDLVAQPDPACQGCKFDDDPDVDTVDLGYWSKCYSGPDRQANPRCAG